MPEIHVVAVPGLPEIGAGDDIGALIGKALATSSRGGGAVEQGDVFVIAQKIVSKAEGAIVELDTVTPSPRAVEWADAYGKDPRQVEVVLRESRRIVRMERGIIIGET